MRETRIPRHSRKGTRGVKTHKRKISSQKKTVPHYTDEDWEYLKITRRMRRLERRFNELTAEKNRIIKQLSGSSSKKTFRDKKQAHAKIKEIDTELSRIGTEWGVLGQKTKNYFVKRGTQIEKFIDKRTQV